MRLPILIYNYCYIRYDICKVTHLSQIKLKKSVCVKNEKLIGGTRSIMKFDRLFIVV